MALFLDIRSLYLLLYVVGTLAFLKLSKIAQCIIFLIFIQCAYIVVNIFTNKSVETFAALMLLNGPILYLIYLKNQQIFVSVKVKLLHLLPFLFILLKDTATYLFAGRENIAPGLADSNIVLGAISQLIYASWVCGKQPSDHPDNLMSTLVKQLGFLLIINGIFNILTQLKGFGMPIDFGFDSKVLSYLSAFLSIILMSRELILDTPGLLKAPNKIAEIWIDEPSIAPLSYRYSPLEPDTLMEIEDQLKKHLTKEQPYLQPDITLDSLSGELLIPKNHISQVLNGYMGKSFYRLIAEYRIEYALELLKDNKNLKIEALAYQCGFNSVSTFNRYFKEIMNMQPSAYIKILEN